MNLRSDVVERLVAEVANADLGDARRTQRLGRVVGRLALAPGAPLPAALETDAEVQAAYRLMNNEEVTFEALLAPHSEAARQRGVQARRVFVLHDTTICDFPTLDPEEIGYLNTGKAGFPLHYSLVVDQDHWRRTLGVIHAEALQRTRPSNGKGKLSGPETAKLTEKEFDRWWRGVRAAHEALTGCEHVLHIADREGDSFELMSKLLEVKAHFVIRVRVNRRGKRADSQHAGWSTVKQVATSCAGVVEREVPLSRRKAKSAPEMNRAHPPRKRRLAKLSFAATAVTIPRPQYLKNPIPESLPLNLVHVIEREAPDDADPVEWLLYTTEAVDKPDQVEAVVDSYRTRWAIEEMNSALKTGCAYEERQFESRHALLNMLALSLPIACELMWLRSRARSEPDAPVSDVLTPSQVEVLRKLGKYKLPEQPTAQQGLLAVAAMGGHLKRNGPPGWEVLYRGMVKLMNFEEAWIAATAAAAKK